jgi:hypothetical protein
MRDHGCVAQHARFEVLKDSMNIPVYTEPPIVLANGHRKLARFLSNGRVAEHDM